MCVVWVMINGQRAVSYTHLDVYKRQELSVGYISVEPNVDIASDHSSVIDTVYAKIIHKEKHAKRAYKMTDWDVFRDILSNKINLKTSLK